MWNPTAHPRFGDRAALWSCCFAMKSTGFLDSLQFQTSSVNHRRRKGLFILYRIARSRPAFPGPPGFLEPPIRKLYLSKKKAKDAIRQTEPGSLIHVEAWILHLGIFTSTPTVPFSDLSVLAGFRISDTPGTFPLPSRDSPTSTAVKIHVHRGNTSTPWTHE